MNSTTFRSLTCLLAGTLLAAASGADTTAQTNDQPVRVAQAATTERNELSELVVTGTRLRVEANGFEAPTPVTSLSTDALAARAPTNFADALNTLPQFNGSATPNSGLGAVPATTSRGNLLNLRGLGFNRVLVLLNGERLPPTQASGGVDLDILPDALVERIDIVTGGASAAYGSDAVSGVVNYVLNEKFTGLKASLQGGTSRYGDDSSAKFSIAGGMGLFDDRLHIEGSFTHYLIDGINRSDGLVRRFGIADAYNALGGNGTVANPFFTVSNARYRAITNGGYIVNGPLAGDRFQPDGSVVPSQPGIPANALVAKGGDGATYPDISPATRDRNDSGYGYLSFDIAPKLKFHASTLIGLAQIRSTTQPPVFFFSGPSSLHIFSDNPYLSPAVVAALGSTTQFTMSRMSPDWWENVTRNNTDYYHAETGLSGSFATPWSNGKDWDWDVNDSYGVSKLRSRESEAITPNVYAALDSAVDPSTGNIVCRANLVSPGSYPGCQPLNAFGLGNASAAALAYIRGQEVFTVRNQMNIVSGNLRGDVGRTWAAPIAVALGAEYRTQKLTQWADSDPTKPPSFQFIRGVPAGALEYNRFNTGAASGKVNVKEAYTEVQVPLAKDVPFAKALDLNGAVRYTKYSTSGSVITWKGGLSWAPIDAVRFRGTLSQDIAAPDLYNLYAGQQIVIAGLQDAHTGVTSQTTSIAGGNSELTPEKAKTLTIGTIVSPLQGFTTSIDYYKIRISNAITTIGAAQLIADCEASNGTSPECGRIIRPLPFSDRSAANYPTQVITSPINAAQQNQSGIDLEMRYQTPLSDFISGWGGNVFADLYVTRLLKEETKSTANLPYRRDLGYASGDIFFPRWKGSMTAGYRNGPYTVQLTERATGSVGKSDIQVYALGQNVWENVWYTSITGSYDFSDHFEGFLFVNNLFNRLPPVGAQATHPGFQNTYMPMYDIVGAYITIGLRAKF